MILTGNLDNLSEKELESRMKQILEDHKSLINITPEDTKQLESETEEDRASD